MQFKKAPFTCIPVENAAAVVDVPEDLLTAVMEYGLIPVLPPPDQHGHHEDDGLPPPWDVIDRIRRRGA